MQQKLPTDKNIKDQYKNGPNGEQEEQLTPEQLKERREAQEVILDEVLPYLRKQAEYNRLQLELTETDILLGNVKSTVIKDGHEMLTVGGLLGIELLAREKQAQGFLMQYAAGMKQAGEDMARMNALSEQEKKAREEFEKLSPEEQAKAQVQAMEEYTKAQKAAEA